jgi:hypothetical protein
MKRILGIIVTLILYINGVSQQPKAYFQQQVNHTIVATLHEHNNSLTASQTITYTNHSNDTLQSLFFHVWMNAFKNDKSYYTRQSIEHNDLRFYFSNNQEKGYTNKISFTVNNQPCNIITDSIHQDIIKVQLPNALLPEQSITINNSFFVQLPNIYSRGGYSGNLYALTQWYPKPAVYDNLGWHTMPYVDQGEFYNEFGNYKVSVNVPKNFVVAGAGALPENINQPNPMLEKLLQLVSKKKGSEKNKVIQSFIQPSVERKTLYFETNNVTDIALFINKNFTLDTGSITLPNGKTILLYNYYLPWHKTYAKGIHYMKKAIMHYSKTVGTYPYETATIVDGDNALNGGMEYPGITIIQAIDDENVFEEVVVHELGHNWFQASLANNERNSPFLDEGFNTYLEQKYLLEKKAQLTPKKTFLTKRIQDNALALIAETMEQKGLSQPLSSHSNTLTDYNYGLIAYLKTSIWLQHIEKRIGTQKMDTVLQQYWAAHKNRHITINNFFEVLKNETSEDTALLSNQLNAVNFLYTQKLRKKITPTWIFSLKDTDKKQYVSFFPNVNVNMHDGLGIGMGIHNYQLPLPKLQFFGVVSYGLQSKQPGGLGLLQYNLNPIHKRVYPKMALAYKQYTYNNFNAPLYGNFYLGYNKLTPTASLFIMPKNVQQKQFQKIQLQYNFIKEDNVRFRIDSSFINGDTTLLYNSSINKTQRSFATLLWYIQNDKALYPFSGEAKADIGNGFIRTSFTYKQFFNYNSKGEGLQVRLFLGKLWYTKQKTFETQLKVSPYYYHLNAPVGSIDYGYTGYFLGRGSYPGYAGGANTLGSNIASQQIMERDGFFKFRTQLLATNDGITDNWLAAINISSHIPDNINPLAKLPIKIPLKVFLDIGTYAEKWKNTLSNNEPKLLANAGLQLTMFKGLVEVYMPIVYSKFYKDYTKSTLVKNTFLKNISFVINTQVLKKSVPYNLFDYIFK